MSASFDRLLEVVLPCGGYLVPMIEAYFDESGCHNSSPVLVVAGYLIESENARALTREWSGILASKNLSHFHMKDCAHRNGEFKNLSPQERVDVQTALIAIIKKYIARGLGASVVPGVYDKLVPQHPLVADAYGACIGNCFNGVRYWVEETGYDGDIAYFFEAGHKSQARTNQFMNWTFDNEQARQHFRYVSHTFIDKRKSAMVQAADFLAWQFFTDRKHKIRGWPRRKDYLRLIGQGDHRTLHMSREHIEEWVNGWSEDYGQKVA